MLNYGVFFILAFTFSPFQIFITNRQLHEIPDLETAACHFLLWPSIRFKCPAFSAIFSLITKVKSLIFSFDPCTPYWTPVPVFS